MSTTLERMPVDNEIRQLVRTAMADWAPSYLRWLVKRGEVPKPYIQQMAELALQKPHLIGIEKPVVLAALKAERPDLYAIVATSDGDAWLEKSMSAMPAALMPKALSSLFGWLGGG